MDKEKMRQLAEEAAEKIVPHCLREQLHWPKPPYIHVHKAGVVPYRLGENGIEYYLFKPSEMMPEMGDPGFQICKGTREIKNPETGEWEDYHSSTKLKEYGPENLEPLIVTALREGIEEIGLPLEEIVEVTEWGQAAFASASTGELKTMWLYPVGVYPDCPFDEPSAEHANTVAREWFDPQNRAQVEKIRPDHLKIIREIDRVLRKQLSNESGLER
ncbi:MAG: hypothetical protein P8P30_04040 [Rickettsiales bacterium]|nr:hypothetical protein [Rickettsiales bacterium]